MSFGWGGTPDQPTGSASARPGGAGVPDKTTPGGTRRQGTTTASKVQLADVRGKTEAAARQTLTGQGLKPAVVYRADKSATPGTVISTNPGPGTQVTAGQTIEVVVAAAPAGPRNAGVGDCLFGTGAPAGLEVRTGQCQPGDFKVLKRFDGTSDTSKCSGVSGYTHDYFATEPPAFVLCMSRT